MKNSVYSLYLVTDHAPDIVARVEQALRGGCTVVQLREKRADSRTFFETAVRLREVTRQYGVPLIINDRADIALAVDADGLHIGQRDLPLAAVRALPGIKTVGVSVSNAEEAVTAERGGADYLGVGAMFATDTKPDAPVTTFEELRRIREAVSLPLVVIGGINPDTIPQFRGAGIDGLAVVSAVLAQPDPAAAARELKTLWAAL